ncbi:MAG: DUF3137 domain-containing protein [Campylobacter sp.]|nr:DUF3137 domain-containing protein [Campylobacter sp.]
MQDIYELENKRKKVVFKLKICIVLSLIVAFVFFIITYLYSSNDPLFSLSTGAFIGLFLYTTLRNFMVESYNHDFKDMVMKKVLASISQNLSYSPNEFISFREFDESKIYQRADIYSGNDLISGEISGVKLKFSDISSKKRVETVDARGNRQVSYQTIFLGILFIAQFNKEFTSRTYVLSRGKRVNFQKIEMDNAEFKKHFNVYTDDIINAFYILSPNFLEQILKLREVFKCPINLAFLDSKIYIYIEFGKDSFEPSISKTLVGDHSIMFDYKNEMENLINLVTRLNLNRKIFIKEKSSNL